MEHQISGWVNNTGASVVIDAEGNNETLKHFISDIIRKPPVLAAVEKSKIVQQKYYGYKDFEIRKSDREPGNIKLISPDIGVCSKCMEEVLNPSSKRYRYAFTNCTECGPRYSIIKALPYDRCNTTMKDFSLCSHCDEEYNSPESRRFHTQPNCCSTCGPSLFLIDYHAERVDSSDAIKKTVEFIKEGRIIAVKGIGGFHLCCDAMNSEAINELRRRKNRPYKPLAVMAGSIDAVHECCELSLMEQELLLSSKRPIVLLKKKEQCMLPENIAPNQKRLGVMLPYSPIHHLLFESEMEFLVMTSGNIGGTPIQYDNDEAIRHLKGIADYFLLHNRDIHNPIDDSVIKAAVGKEIVSRRARGYSPYSQKLDTAEEILALGAEQKSTICLSQNGYAYMSQYLGDLKDLDTYALYKKTIENMTDLFQFKPKLYAHDLHPQYLSTRYAMQQRGRRVAVQHHHAHMVSCMVEHKLFGNVIGVIFDGTGLGNDGSIWGGEFLIGDRRSFQRAGHLKPVLLQGGDMAAIEPWRSAVCYLYHLGYDPKDFLEAVNTSNIKVVLQALVSNFNCHLSTSMGRLFDCVAALIGIRQNVTYDAQAAIELENIVDHAIDNISYSYSINENNDILELDFAGIIDDILIDKKCSKQASTISARFHNTISNAAVDIVLRLRKKYQINNVVLSGGVFENIYLIESVYRKLKDESFRVYFNGQIPVNDSGISIGQLAIANEVLRK